MYFTSDENARRLEEDNKGCGKPLLCPATGSMDIWKCEEGDLCKDCSQKTSNQNQKNVQEGVSHSDTLGTTQTAPSDNPQDDSGEAKAAKEDTGNCTFPADLKSSEELNPAHYCMGDCNKYLGFRGFCSTKCYNENYDFDSKSE